MLDLDDLAPSWQRQLRARNRSERTIQSYAEGLSQFRAHLAECGRPTAVADITRADVESFVTALLVRYKPATAAVRYRSLQQFWRWALAEGEVTVDPMAGMSPPSVPEQPVPVLPLDAIRRLLATCERRSFDGRRDAAIITLLLDTGIRRAELAGIAVDDLDLDHQTVIVTGKGRRQRLVQFSATASAELDRYLRARRSHPRSDLPALWLGPRGRFTDSGVAQMLERRAALAGLDKVHAHQFRHTFAHQWRLQGGHDDELMALGGWRSRQMLDRYGRSAVAERAREAHKRLSPADRLQQP